MEQQSKGNQLAQKAEQRNLRSLIFERLGNTNLVPHRRSYYSYVGTEIIQLIVEQGGWLDYTPTQLATDLQVPTAGFLFKITQYLVAAGVLNEPQTYWVIGEDGKPQQRRRLTTQVIEVA